MDELESDPLAALKATIAGVIGNLTNPALDGKGAHGAKYTTLGALSNHLRQTLAEARIATSFSTWSDTSSVTVELHVFDIDTGDTLPMGSLTTGYRDVQQMGGAITYLRRYLLTSVFSIVGEDDDDGARASKRPAKRSEPSNDQPSTPRPEGEISAAQLKSLQIRYSAIPRAERLAIWAEKLGRPVASAKELSKAEAIVLLTEDMERGPE